MILIYPNLTLYMSSNKSYISKFKITLKLHKMNLHSATYLLQDFKFNIRITILFYIEILLPNFLLVQRYCNKNSSSNAI